MLLGPIVLLIVFIAIWYKLEWCKNILEIGVLMIILTTFMIFCSDMLGQYLGWWSVIC